jgi:hypothetical protein
MKFRGRCTADGSRQALKIPEFHLSKGMADYHNH